MSLLCSNISLHTFTASFNTHFPTGIIKPLSSSIGINSTGETLPNFSHFHLNKASTPFKFAVLQNTCG